MSAWNVVLLIASLQIICSNGVEVSTSLGKIRGVVLKSRLGEDFNAFRGIRYAKAPVGELRFKNPLPVDSWKPNVFDATADGPMCTQETDDLSEVSEDCLLLNVYTKNVNGSKPVIIYMHPGGYYSGTGQSKTLAGPQSMMDRNVVFVTINYRLGTLGFMATGTKDAPGNAGLKDQVIAFRWVKNHIRNFGGDPNCVTLFGYSAGAESVGLHMLSPMSRGLFHRAITMSGSPIGQSATEHSDLRLAKKQAKLFNCPESPIEDMVKCMKTKTTIDYVNTTADMFDFNWNPILNWEPVIEEDFGQERFLVENPYKTILSGNINKVPLITGITEFEFYGAAYYSLSNDTTREWFNNDFEKYAPIAFTYERDTPRSREISAVLRSKYLNNTLLKHPDSLEPFGNLYSDGVEGFKFHRFLNLISRHTSVYNYFFRYKGRYSHFHYPENQVYGAVHHDELLYLLYVPVMTPLFKQTDPENELIERLTRMWTEFATKGDPNNPNDEFIKGANWKLYTNDKQEYLEIGNDLTMKEGGIYTERYQIWDELFPIPNKYERTFF